jgi:hypothetical protein
MFLLLNTIGRKAPLNPDAKVSPHKIVILLINTVSE